MVLIHVFEVVLLTDEQVQVLFPVSMDGLHVSLKNSNGQNARVWCERKHNDLPNQQPNYMGYLFPPTPHLDTAQWSSFMILYLNDILPRMLSSNQLLSIIIQFGDGGLFGLQTFTDEVLWRWDKYTE